MIAALALLLLAQQAPTIGELETQEYDFGGGYKLQITPKLKETKLGKFFYSFSCANVCKGKKHILHGECDTSCDTACSMTHKQTLNPFIQPGFTEEQEHPEKLTEAVKDIQSKTKPAEQKADERDIVGGYLRKLEEDAFGTDLDKLRVEVKWKHWATEPCARVSRTPLAWIYQVEVTWSVTQEIKDANGKPEIKKGAWGTFTIGLGRPTDKYEDGKPKVDCKCSVVSDKPEKMNGPTDETAYIQKCGPPVEACSAGDLDKFGFTVTCSNMNEGVCTATNYLPTPVDLCVQEGTCFECVDGSSQDTLCVEGCKLHLPAASPFLSLCGGVPSVTVSAPIRLQCLNMHKGEPKAGLKYVPRLPASGDLGRLAKFQSNQMIGGPWDQTRTWIYTDHATLGEIDKVLFPPPSEGAYLKAAYQLATVVPSFDFSQPENRPCLEPKLIAGNLAPREATQWFVDRMSILDPEGFAAWINANPAAFAPLWTNTALAVNPRHLADVASALLSSRNATVRKAGVQFMLKTIPADKRDLVISNKGLNGLDLALLGCADADEATALLDVAEAYTSGAIGFGLRNLSRKLPDSVRARASKLAG